VAAPAGASTLLRSLTAYSGQVLRSGSSGGAVKAVQQAVRTTVDSRYGAGTASAVARWQRAHGLTGSGVVSAATWRALLRAYKPATPIAKPASPLTPYKGLVLRYNSRGPAVVALQKALRVTPASGWFGTRTRTAVIDFQRRHRLPATGVVESRTWKALGA
jgi:peptidoglycan hydrolase-like protein with peptidoglycan-binding domain